MSISPRLGPIPPIIRLQGSQASESVQGLQDAGTRATDTVEISDSSGALPPERDQKTARYSPEEKRSICPRCHRVRPV